jgi:hypothetical protein
MIVMAAKQMTVPCLQADGCLTHNVAFRRRINRGFWV